MHWHWSKEIEFIALLTYLPEENIHDDYGLAMSPILQFAVCKFSGQFERKEWSKWRTSVSKNSNICPAVVEILVKSDLKFQEIYDHLFEDEVSNK